jgi:CelD/BcsL family acetyltransferase involved in cellulose biosynthesis
MSGLQGFAAEMPAFAEEETQAAALAGDCTAVSVEVVATLSGIEALAADWTALEALAAPACVFQSHAQIRIWAQHFLTGRKRQRLHVAVVRERGRAVLILPLALSGTGLCIARMAGDPLAQYSDILLDPAADAPRAFAAALASLERAGIDAVVFRRMRQDSALLALAGGRLRPGTAEDAAPYADLAAHPSFDHYLKSLSKTFRKNLRNRQNHLEKEGEACFEVIAGGAAARAALTEALDLKHRWLVQRGAVSSAFLERATHDCLLDLAERAEETGAVVMRLSVGGRAAAIRFGFEYRGTYFAYLSAYDPAFAHLAPGKLLMESYLSGFKERGLARIDMLPPRDRHKSDWCRLEMPVADHTLPLTTRGRIFAELYQERLRPALKRTWHCLPTALRSLAVGMFISA